ncbi:MAG: transferrin-binding protein-like solute binding protein, partial [Alphaproteobacteria bacterium]|nr:transferrin-binding protein-like solute binding protein [Alphaproteobacteria bacterium]
ALDADWDYIGGDAAITANFTGTGGSIGFASDGVGTYAGSAYSLTGGGAISGNRYLGTVSGWYDDGAGGDLVLDAASSTLSGAFYGPNAEETAGVVYATSSYNDPYWGELAGGFWAQ